MWIENKKKKEWIPFDTEHTDKVFWDGEKGWAIKQKDGTVCHIDQEQYEKKVLRELDSDAYWKMKQIEDASQDLSKEEKAKLRKFLKELSKSDKKEEDD